MDFRRDFPESFLRVLGLEASITHTHKILNHFFINEGQTTSMGLISSTENTHLTHGACRSVALQVCPALSVLVRALVCTQHLRV